jgi:hypothetical protein
MKPQLTEDEIMKVIFGDKQTTDISATERTSTKDENATFDKAVKDTITLLGSFEKKVEMIYGATFIPKEDIKL